MESVRMKRGNCAVKYLNETDSEGEKMLAGMSSLKKQNNEINIEKGTPLMVTERERKEGRMEKREGDWWK